jgi:hypothetical protein
LVQCLDSANHFDEKEISMIARMLTAALLLATAASLAGCEKSVWERPANVVGSAMVEKITKDTRYSKAFGELTSVYDVELRDAEPADLKYVHVSGKIEEDDMARSIGKRVSIKCYREQPGSACYASGYGYDGRELVTPRN